jgi:peptide/nickel transport system substrate-binding protein
VWDEVPFVPLGLTLLPQAYRRGLTGIITGGPALFWNVRRA